MRTTNGIVASSSFYKVTSVAVKDGNVESVTFTVDHKDTKAARQMAAEMLEAPVSRVVVDFELCRHALVIDCDYKTLTDSLTEAGIEFEEK